MNRLQKKCFIASTGIHLLLPVILVLGSALTPKSKTEDSMPVLDFIPLQTTDLQMSGGGNPKVSTPPQFNKPIPPTPKPPDPVEATPPKPAEEESFEPRKESNKKPLPNVPTKLTNRKNPNAPKTMAKKAPDNSAEREAAEARKKLLNEIGSAANDLRENASTTVKFTDGFRGPGGGGIPYANFLQAVKTVYTHAWNLPDDVNDDNATTAASVTIARDGRVVRSSILRKSGNAMVDHSVQMTLDRVRYVAPLPNTAAENERTVTINFNVKAKRLSE